MLNDGFLPFFLFHLSLSLSLSMSVCVFACALTRATKNNTGNKYLCVQNLWIFTLYLSFLIHPLTIHVTSDTPPPYTPHDTIALDCGSSTNSTTSDGGRPWIGDYIDPKISLLESENNKSTTSTAPQQPKSGDKVPYITARLSFSQFAYVFPVTSGQKFIRFYFYPTSYTNFDPSKAFFSVTAGPFNLLSNFSALINAQSQDQDTVFREFCVNIEEDQKLYITFTPNHDNPDAYAFINGIEIVSMPSNLYYTEANTNGFNFVGQQNLYSVGNSSALEMMYRINVGGKSLTPEEDTGMYRSWSHDKDYLTDAQPSALTVYRSIVLSFSKIANYTAPREVYITARSMGLNKTTNENYNLTWEFPVDSGFIYFVRLHFCEFQLPVTEPFDRVFEIYITNITAEEQADVIRWSGRNGVPIYKDYAVIIRGSQKAKQNLSIALHPNPSQLMTRKPAYTDVILNGIEIFKVSNVVDLFATNPDPVLLSPTAVAPPSQQSTKLAIVAGVVSGFVVLSIIGFLTFLRKMRVKDSGSSDGASQCGPFSSTTKSTKFPGSHLPSDLSRHFSLDEIKAATNNFQEDLIIGVGGFGNVYKGFMDEGSKIVAIKRLNPESTQGAREFRTEIEMLSQLRHVHLVSLIGYCNDENEMIVVYDFMINGTLRDHLYDTKNDPLPWKQRLKICKGAAIGLHYLHTGLEHTIIHRDVKTTNILLDKKWTAKVSDFGLSKMDRNTSMMNTVVKGTFGYLDPEYARGLPLTEKSDVYSFGVVLFEVLCARKAVDRKLGEDQMNLVYWARNCINNGNVHHIIDPYLMGKIAPECFKVFLEIAESCVREEGIKRPTMYNLVEKLTFALELQENADAENDRIYTDGKYLYPATSFHVAQYDNVDGGTDMESSICSMSTAIDTNAIGMSFPSHASGSATVLGETSNSKGQ